MISLNYFLVKFSRTFNGMKFFLLIISPILLIACSSASNKSPKETLEIKAYNANKSGDYINSVNYYNQLLKDDSLNGEYYFGRAYANGMLEKTNDAKKDYLKSIQLNYRKGSSYYSLGLLNTYLNDSVAIIYFKKALDIYPKYEIDLKKADIQKEIDECLERLKTKPGY